ncbi:MAG: TM2 domain-containing protein [Halopseudomonas aestusnigri]
MPHKSLPIAYLLWLFTGVFGGHRWYLGKRWSAATILISSLFFFFWLRIFAFKVFPDNIQGLQDMYSYMLLNPLQNIRFSFRYFSNNVLHILLNFTFWFNSLLLLFDLFWIYFAVRKQSKALTQQQVEAFD